MIVTRQRSRFRPRVERLEDRAVPTATATTLSTSLNPAMVGQSITLTATVTGGAFAAGGDAAVSDTITFLDGVTTLNTVKPTPTGGPNKESRAQFTTTNLGVGTHALLAKYSGGSDHTLNIINDASNSGTVNEVVNAAPSQLLLLDVSALVSVTKQRHHNPLRQQVTLRNIGGTTIDGPVYLLLGGLGAKVRLKNAAGIAKGHGHPGEPFVESNVNLHAGGKITLTLVFDDPRHKPIRYHTAVLAGPGTI